MLGSCKGGGEISAPLTPLAAPSGSATAKPMASTESQTVIASRDFSDDLPDNLKSLAVERKTSTLEVKDGGFTALVHYDDLVGQAGYFRYIEIEVPSAPDGIIVTADIGNPINRGSTSKPAMAVPVKIQWSGSRQLQTRMWEFSFDGTLRAQD